MSSRSVIAGAAACWLVLLAACGPAKPTPPAHGFGDGFLFGTATAGFQSDMGCPTVPKSECADTNSDWYAYVTSKAMQADGSTHLSGEDPAVVGPGEYELYPKDLDLAKNDLHDNAFRMSLEWSRIFPTSTVGVEGYDALKKIANQTALAHYHAVFAALKARGMTPLVTIDHYTLPLWIHDGVACHTDIAGCTKRGWLDHDVIVHEIAKYAGFVAKEFGGEVDLWATLNEPFAVVLSGYVFPSAQRSNPPAVTAQYQDARDAFVAMVDAHAAMYDAVKANDTVDADGDGKAALVGLVYNMAPAVPADPGSRLDQSAAQDVFYLWNLAFLDAVALGRLDANLDGTQVDHPELAHRLDFVGINYYVRFVVTGTSDPVLPDLSPLTDFDPFTLSTDIYPKGLYDMVKLVHDRYHLPSYITENDAQHIPQGDEAGEIADEVRELQWLQKAREDGLGVRGWFYWSLTDNFEWNHGMDERYGLYAVDPNDPQKKRVARSTVDVIGRIDAAGEVPSDLAASYPIQ